MCSYYNAPEISVNFSESKRLLVRNADLEVSGWLETRMCKGFESSSFASSTKRKSRKRWHPLNNEPANISSCFTVNFCTWLTSPTFALNQVVTNFSYPLCCNASNYPLNVKRTYMKSNRRNIFYSWKWLQGLNNKKCSVLREAANGIQKYTIVWALSWKWWLLMPLKSNLRSSSMKTVVTIGAQRSIWKSKTMIPFRVFVIKLSDIHWNTFSFP